MIGDLKTASSVETRRPSPFIVASLSSAPEGLGRRRSGDPATVAEEAAFAYKDIEAVMAASTSLVKPVRRLTPLGVVKG